MLQYYTVPSPTIASSSFQCYYPFDRCFSYYYRVTVLWTTTAWGILQYSAVPSPNVASSSLQCYYPFDNCFRYPYRVTVVSTTTAWGIWQTYCHFNCSGSSFFKCAVYLKTWKLSCVCIETWKLSYVCVKTWKLSCVCVKTKRTSEGLWGNVYFLISSMRDQCPFAPSHPSTPQPPIKRKWYV